MERNQNPAFVPGQNIPDAIILPIKCPHRSRPSKNRSMIYCPVITLLNIIPFNEIRAKKNYVYKVSVLIWVSSEADPG